MLALFSYGDATVKSSDYSSEVSDVGSEICGISYLFGVSESVPMVDMPCYSAAKFPMRWTI